MHNEVGSLIYHEFLPAAWRVGGIGGQLRLSCMGEGWLPSRAR